MCVGDVQPTFVNTWTQYIGLLSHCLWGGEVELGILYILYKERLRKIVRGGGANLLPFLKNTPGGLEYSW